MNGQRAGPDASLIADPPSPEVVAELARRDDEIRSLARDDPRAGRAAAERWSEEAAADISRAARAWATRALAHCLRSSGELEAAVAAYESAEVSFGVVGDALERARTGLGHVWTLRLLGRYPEAIRLARDTQAELTRLGDPFRAASQGINLGAVYRRQGRLDAAAAVYRETLRALRRLPAVVQTQQVQEYAATCLSNLGNVLAETGQYAPAERAQLRAERIYRQLGQRSQIARALMNVGLVRVRRGDYGNAVAALQEARRIFESLDLPSEVAVVEIDLTRAYLELNLMAEAIETCEHVVARLQGLTLPYELGQALLWSALLAERLGRLDAAHADAAEAATVYEQLGNELGSALASARALTLAAADAEPAALPVLLGRLAQLRSRLQVLGAREDALRVRLHEASILTRLCQQEQAADEYAAAIAEAQELRSEPLTYESQAGIARVLEETAPEESLSHYRAAIETFESLRARARADDLKLAFGESRVDVYERAVKLTLDGGDREADRWDAFALVERSKSRGLLDQLLERAQNADRHARALSTRVRELRARLSAQYFSAYEAGQADQARSPVALSDRTRELERQLEIATRELQLALPGRVADEQAPVASLGERLPPDSGLVVYHSIGDELLAFVLTAAGLAVRRNLASVVEVRHEMERVRFHIGKSAYGADYLLARLDSARRTAERPLATLWQQLVAPLGLRLADLRRLYVVPHGSLHSVPFHALYSGGEYLYECVEVVSAPSSSLLRLGESGCELGFRRPLLVGPDDPSIPWAGHEVAAIAAIVPNAIVLKGKRATVRSFARQAPRSDCLHLATHGIFRSDNPSFSSLRLADGWITVADLKESCRSARLVTMSACESGVTDVRAGDELLGLSRAVLGAGAASLVASLWPVHDESAARLMTAFYRRLSQGDSLAASLCAAMAEQRRATDHPYFWAPFTLIGAA